MSKHKNGHLVSQVFRGVGMFTPVTTGSDGETYRTGEAVCPGCAMERHRATNEQFTRLRGGTKRCATCGAEIEEYSHVPEMVAERTQQGLRGEIHPY